MSVEMDKPIVTDAQEILAVLELFSALPSVKDSVEEIQQQVERVRSSIAEQTIPHLPNISSAHFGMIGVCALYLIRDEVSFKKLDFCKMLLGKHKRYGAKPLRAWGSLGIIIRIHSKLERFINLSAQPGLRTDDESLVDTLNDILGYAVLGYLMV